MKINFRSSCPLASTLDIIGDKWSLLIIRDMLIQQKKTFKDFSDSAERIAPGILSARLKLLEDNELITKQKLPNNQKENIYLLTDKGIDLTPVIMEIILWSDKNLRNQNANMYSLANAGFDKDKFEVIKSVQNNYREIVRNILG